MPPERILYLVRHFIVNHILLISSISTEKVKKCINDAIVRGRFKEGDKTIQKAGTGLQAVIQIFASI